MKGKISGRETKRTIAEFRVEGNTPAIDAATKAALERGLRRVAIHWHGEARQRAPVDYGRLQSSIAFAAPGTNPAVQVEASPGNPAGIFQPQPVQGLEAFVGSNVNYAAPVHELHPTQSGFIENPGNEYSARYQGILREEVIRATTGLAAAAD